MAASVGGDELAEVGDDDVGALRLELLAVVAAIDTDDQGERLLDNTSVLLTSNLGNGSNHDNRNMPVLLGGGRFSHGQHLAFDRTNNYPLPNLYVDLLQQVGLETDHFASSTGTMRGLA